MQKLSTLVLLILFSKVLSQMPADFATLPDYNFPRIKSSVSMPVKIPLAEIAQIINTSVQNLVFEDNSFTDNDNDQFKVKVWKTRPIRLVGGTNQNLLIEVPLKIQAEKGIGSFGIYSYQNTTFETVMYFNTQVTLNNNWTMVTKTTPMGFRWVSKPVLDFGKIKLPITSFVESSLRKQQAEFSKTIDEMMLKQLNFRQYVISAWNMFSQPFHISEEYSTFLKITPISVNISPLIFYGNQIEANIVIDTFSETFSGTKPVATPLIKTVANFNSVQNLPQNFLLQTTANIPFSEATKIAEKAFLGRDFNFRDGKSKIKITAVKVEGQGDRIVIEARTEGSVEGVSYISGIPFYDEVQREIVLRDTQFKLQTKNILQKTATLLFRKRIVDVIENKFGIPTTDVENDARKSIEKTFNQEYYKGLKLTGKVFQLKPSQIILNENGITVVIDTQARLMLFVQGI